MLLAILLPELTTVPPDYSKMLGIYGIGMHRLFDLNITITELLCVLGE